MPIPKLARRLTAVALGAATAASLSLAVPSSAQADDTTTLTVLGTSDVSDSFLVQSVIKPGFERAYPNVTLNYLSSGSGQAIQAAESGQGSALIVHAASLENQFVDQGFSLGGAGRAIFYGDFVLAGPASDPAGVLNGSTHDIVTAFEKIAAAGEQGDATFVSRGGTPGTTVAEHSIWPLTTGVTTCQVSDGNGGGATPSTTAGDCPATVTPPSWYKVTGAKQGANVQAADTCSSGTFPNGGCYVFTDRGTFQYLEAQKLLTTLKIVVRDNDAAARGGSTILTNSFHAYAVDPAKFAGNPNVNLNPTAAKEFLDYLTKPSTQADIGAYLANTPEGAPFLPDAAPLITASAPVTKVAAGSKITIKGLVRNVVPGTPVLSDATVSLRVTPKVASAASYVGATAKTDSAGKYTLTYTPVGAATYTVTTAQMTRLERADLKPSFSDVLSPGTTSASGAVTVQGRTKFLSVAGSASSVSGSVKLAPADAYQTGELQLYGARYAKTMPKLHFIASVPIARGKATAAFRYYLPKGTFYVQLHYVNNGVILPGTTGVKKLTVG